MTVRHSMTVWRSMTVRLSMTFFNHDRPLSMTFFQQGRLHAHNLFLMPGMRKTR